MKIIQIIIFFSVFFLSCSSFFYKHKKLNTSYERGDFKKAEKILNSKKGIKSHGKDKLLNLIYNGIILHMQNKYKESNEFLEKAYQRIRNYRSNKVKDTFALLVSPISSDYMGEDPEILIVNYIKACNYLFLDNMELALQECRRMELALKMMKQKYKKNTIYKKDAFLYLFMGLIYEANYEFNNAFLCYKNAVLVYDSDYKKNFGINIPLQLKKDLLRMAYIEGFHDELDHFKKIFEIKYEPPKKKNNIKNELIILWNNGLGPYKDSIDIVFAVNPSVGGLVNFKNEEHGLNFSFPIPATKRDSSILDTNFFKVSFPKYVSRKPFFINGKVLYDNETYVLELIEDFNKICFACLKQRMVWEFSKILMRLFLKKITEYNIKNISPVAGMATNIFNTISEIPDTRCVSIIPNKIYYARVPLKSSDKRNINIKLFTKNNYITKSINFKKQKKNIQFFIFHTLDTMK